MAHLGQAENEIKELNHHSSSPGLGGTRMTNHWFPFWGGFWGFFFTNENQNIINQIPTQFCISVSHLNSLPSTGTKYKQKKIPTQPTNNRFACLEEPFSTLDALPGCGRLTECPWA